jgi:hypothetical protein
MQHLIKEFSPRHYSNDFRCSALRETLDLWNRFPAPCAHPVSTQTSNINRARGVRRLGPFSDPRNSSPCSPTLSHAWWDKHIFRDSQCPTVVAVAVRFDRRRFGKDNVMCFNKST